jgi:ATP-dependent Clp protease adaptor protein ClpS
MSTDLDIVEDISTKLKPPHKWTVVLHNDDVTPMEFVVELLQRVFYMDIANAATLMIDIHTTGSGVAGTYTHEIAEQKLVDALKFIASHRYSLKATLEEA